MIDFRTTCTDHQCLFIRTRLEMSEGGFLMTIHNMMEVARDKLYLWGSVSMCCVSRGIDTGADMRGDEERGEGEAYQVKMY